MKINSLEYYDLDEWQEQIEKVLEDGHLPVIQNFRRDVHLETTIGIAFRHRLTVLLNPQQTECQFRRHL